MEASNIEDFKKNINDKVKIVKYSFDGVLLERKLISITEILEEFSRKNGIPVVDKFAFFNLEAIKKKIYKYPNLANDKKIKKIKELNTCIKEFEKILELTNFMKEKSQFIRENLIICSFNGFSFIYTENLDNIKEIQQQLNKLKQNLDKNILRNIINECKINFKEEIKEELSRHELIDKNKPINDNISEKVDSIIDRKMNVDKLLRDIKLEIHGITDISDEMIKDTEAYNKIMNSKISENIKNEIEKYRKLKK